MTRAQTISITLLAAILLLAAGLRFYRIGGQSFWLDELLSLEASCGRGQTDQALPRGQIISAERLTKLEGAPPAWKVWTTLEKDSHPPAYYLLLRGWRDLLGDGEGSIRAMSALWSILSVGLIYFVGRRIAGDWAGLCAALLMAVSPLQVLYAQEARNYAMLCATMLLAAWALLRAVEKDSISRLVMLGASLLLAMLTHYLAAPVLAALAVFARMQCKGAKRRRMIATFVGAAVVYAIVWGPFVLSQRDSFHGNSSGAKDVAKPGILRRAFVRAGCEPLREIGGKSWEGSDVAALAAIAVTGCLIASIIARRDRMAAAFPVLWYVFPLLFLALVDVAAGDATLTFPRYTFGCSPGLFLFIGWLVAGEASHDPPRSRYREMRLAWRFIGAGACAYSLVSLPAAYRNWKADWRGLAAGLDQKSQPGDVIVLATNQPQTWWLGGAVLGITHYSSQPAKMMLLDHPAAESEVALLAHGWLILHGVDTSPEELLPGLGVIQVGSDFQIGRIYRIVSSRR